MFQLGVVGQRHDAKCKCGSICVSGTPPVLSISLVPVLWFLGSLFCSPDLALGKTGMDRRHAMGNNLNPAVNVANVLVITMCLL